MVPDDMVAPEQRTEATVVLKSLLEFKPDQFGLPPFQNPLSNSSSAESIDK